MKKLTVLLVVLVSVMAISLSACTSNVDFKISFIVDGEVYDTITTSGDILIKMPEKPTKDGYTFDGWYRDEGTWNKPFMFNSLIDEPLSSDISVYAKWTKNGFQSATPQNPNAGQDDDPNAGETDTDKGESDPSGGESQHVHDYGNWINEIPATCSNKGTLGHYQCSGCHKYFDSRKRPLSSIEIPINKDAHKWDNGKEVQAPTCTTPGVKTFTCEYNEQHTKNEDIKIDPNAHEYEITLSYDRYFHYNKCKYCGDKKGAEVHNFGDNKICSICSYEADYTFGLEFEPNDDGVTCTLSGMGTANEKDIVIPENYYDGEKSYAVTSISAKVFKDSDITSIVVPSSVTTIPQGIFNGCNSLTSITCAVCRHK